MDRYQEVIDRLYRTDEEIKKLIDLRDEQIKNNQKTGRVEYQLQDNILKAEVDIKKLEELALVYKNEPEKCEGISEKKLNKRINEIGEEVKKFRRL